MRWLGFLASTFTACSILAGGGFARLEHPHHLPNLRFGGEVIFDNASVWPRVLSLVAGARLVLKAAAADKDHRIVRMLPGEFQKTIGKQGTSVFLTSSGALPAFACRHRSWRRSPPFGGPHLLGMLVLRGGEFFFKAL